VARASNYSWRFANVSKPAGNANFFRCVPSAMIFARFKIRGKQMRKSLKIANLDWPRTNWWRWSAMSAKHSYYGQSLAITNYVP
jgi:hypothetical protein